MLQWFVTSICVKPRSTFPPLSTTAHYEPWRLKWLTNSKYSTQLLCTHRVLTRLTLQHRIMDTSHEFYASQDPIDVNLYADLIVAIWRFDNPGAVKDVFPICLALDRSDAVKATAVRALVTIVSEVGPFSQNGQEKDG